MVKQLKILVVVCLLVLAMVAVGCPAPETVTVTALKTVTVTATKTVTVPATATTPAPSGPTTYTNTEHGFSIILPEGWIEGKTGFPNEVVSFAPGPQPMVPDIVVYLESVEAGTTIDELGPQRSQQLSQEMDEFQLISEGEVKLNDGTPAYEIECQFLVMQYNVYIQEKSLYVIRGTELFSITGADITSSFAASEAKLDGSIYTFHLQ
jgi:hypothetical protein